MKVKVNRKIMLQAAEKAAKMIRRSIIAISDCFYVEVKDGALRFHVFADTTYLITSCETIYHDESFCCVFPHGIFLNTLKTIRNDEVVLEYNQDQNNITLSGGRVHLQIACSLVENWPLHENKEDPECEITTSELLPALKECSHALPSGETTNPIMRSYCVEQTVSGWKITALDGKRIAIRGDWDAKVQRQLLLDGQVMNSIQNIFKGEVKLQLQKNWIAIRDENTIVYVTTIDGQYYNVDSMIKSSGETVRFPRDKAIEVCELATNILDANAAAKMVLDGDSCIMVTSKNQTGTDLNCEISAEYTADFSSCVMGVNPRYLLDALKTLKDDYVVMEISGSTVPIIIKENRQLELICPCKIS